MRAAFLLPSLCLSLTAQTPLASTAQDRKALSLTLYQGNFSLVREVRSFKAPEGPFRLHVEGLPKLVQEESIQVEARHEPSRLSIATRSFFTGRQNFMLVLDRFVGEKVKVTSLKNGSETMEEGVLVTVVPSILVQFPDRVEALSIDANRRLVLPFLPTGFNPQPALDLEATASPAGEMDLAVDYQCQGLNWRCEYAGTLDREDSVLDLKAWATLSNQTNVAFTSASVQLFAGGIPGIDGFDRMGGMSLTWNYVSTPAKPAAPPPPPPPLGSDSTGGHAVYPLPHPVTLLPSQTLQISLLASHQVPVRKIYSVTWPSADNDENGEEGGRQFSVETALETTNDERHQLGRALPGGSIRLFQPDEKGQRQFIGAPSFPETATDMKLHLSLGSSPEVTARGRSLKEKVTAVPNSKLTLTEQARELVLTNRKAKEQTVRVLVPLEGEWQVLQSNRPWKKDSAHILAFDVSVPAQGKATLSFQVRVKA